MKCMPIGKERLNAQEIGKDNKKIFYKEISLCLK